MSHPVLYSFRRCPYAIRARMAILYSGIQVELREIVLKEKPLAMLDISPKGTVPVLLTEEGVIDESRDVMLWALEQSPELKTKWLPSSLDVKIDRLLDRNDNEFKRILDRYKYFERYPDNPREFYLKQAQPFLQLLESQLNQNGFLLSSQATLADIGIFPFIRQFAFADKDRFDQLPYPLLQQWLNSFLESEQFRIVMKKIPRWDETTTGDQLLFP